MVKELSLPKINVLLWPCTLKSPYEDLILVLSGHVLSWFSWGVYFIDYTVEGFWAPNKRILKYPIHWGFSLGCVVPNNVSANQMKCSDIDVHVMDPGNQWLPADQFFMLCAKISHKFEPLKLHEGSYHQTLIWQSS